MGGVLTATAIHPPRVKPGTGARQAAQLAAAQPRSNWLISTCTTGEGPFISELAAIEPTPRHHVWRASKILARSDLMGRGYRLLAPDARAVAQVLDEKHIGWVVTDCATLPPRWQHHQLLAAVLARPGWRPVLSTARTTVYRRQRP
jgi:hypothetical protein